MTAPAVAQSNSFARTVGDLQVVDFRRPHRVAKERLRALELMHERLTKSLEGWLLSRVRGPIELRLGTIKEAQFVEVSQTLDSPCCAFLLDIKDCGGQQGVINFGLDLSYFMIDRLFGGYGDPIVLGRMLSPIERMALRVIAERVLALLSEGWHERMPIAMELSGFESVPEILMSGARETSVLVVEIGVTFPGNTDKITLTLPMIALEAFFTDTDQLKRGHIMPIGSQKELDANRDLAEAQLRIAHVPVRACLPDFHLTMRDVAGIKPGMVLPTMIPVNAPIQTFVGSQARFKSAAGRVGSKLAVRILDNIDAPNGALNSSLE